MLTHSYYEEDPRVRREAESLVRAGRPVEVFGLRRPDDGPEDVIDGVRLHRLDVQRHQGASLPRYLAEYVEFLLRASVAAVAANRRARFALVQVHTLPDFLVFAALPFRLAGTPVLLDLHEAMPEFFRMRFAKACSPLVLRALLAQELASIAAADAVLTVNDALAARLVGLGVAPDKVTVVLNSPDLERFDPGRFHRRSFMADGTLRLVYAGALTPTYELDVALDAMARLNRARPDLPVTLDVYGRGDAERDWRQRSRDLGLADAVHLHGRIPIEAMPEALSAADIGLAPTRRTQFTDYSLSTKIFEYAAMAKPVVASRLPLVEATFPEGSVATYEAGDAGSMAAAILRIVDEPLEREARVVRTGAAVAERSWAHESDRYLRLIERLIAARATGGAGPPGAAAPEAAPAVAEWPESDAPMPPTPAEPDAATAYAGRP
jgi:glycosyltransferase involved in cell wall biosynthesis